MSRKLLSLCCALALVAGMMGVSATEARASEEQPMIDGSYLTHDDESVGYDTKKTRGEDLLVGYSKCARLGPGKLYVGGTTIAAHTVDDIGLTVSVERAQRGDDRWTGYTAWQKFNAGVDRIASNKTLEVEGGYYYRVCCTHSANSDMSSSFTDGVYIDEP